MIVHGFIPDEFFSSSCDICAATVIFVAFLLGDDDDDDDDDDDANNKKDLLENVLRLDARDDWAAGADENTACIW